LTLDRGPTQILAGAMNGSARRFVAAVIGTALIALCCFTPILVILLASIGFATFTPYLDYVLYPSLALMLFVTWRAYREYTRSRKLGHGE
jgi:mercuric ion transport protein